MSLVPTVFWSLLPQQTHSPYIRDLANGLTSRGWQIKKLSLGGLARSKREIVHIQWPEHVSRGSSPSHTVAKNIRACMLAALVVARKHRIVLTAHNRSPHGKTNKIDQWFRRFVESRSAAITILAPGHEELLRSDEVVPANAEVVYIAHPVQMESLIPRTVDVETAPLLVLGLIHKYHLIEEFVTTLHSGGSERQVLVVGRTGDDKVLHRLEQLDSRLPWLSVLGPVSDDELDELADSCAAVVSLQAKPFSSGAPFFALSRGIPVVLSDGAQAKDLAHTIGDEWVFATPSSGPEALNLDHFDQWLRADRSIPDVSAHSIATVADGHIELYESLRS